MLFGRSIIPCYAYGTLGATAVLRTKFGSFHRYVFGHDGSEIQMKTGSSGFRKVCSVHFGGINAKDLIFPFFTSLLSKSFSFFEAIKIMFYYCYYLRVCLPDIIESDLFDQSNL